MLSQETFKTIYDMKLKDILKEKKRSQALKQEQAVCSTANKAAEFQATYPQPSSEFYALFEGCTDF